MHKQLGKVRPCGFRVMQADRQTNGQLNRHTHHNTSHSYSSTAHHVYHTLARRRRKSMGNGDIWIKRNSSNSAFACHRGQPDIDYPTTITTACSLSSSGVPGLSADVGIGPPPPQQLHSLARATVPDPTLISTSRRLWLWKPVNRDVSAVVLLISTRLSTWGVWAGPSQIDVKRWRRK